MIIIISSCSIDQGKYFEYLNNPANGLVKTSSSSNAIYKLIYYPIDLMIAKDKSISKKSVNQLRKDYGNLDYFLIEIDKSSKVIDEKQSFYYAYKLEKDIYQISGRDTLRPSLFQLEQGITGSQAMRINLAFPSINDDRQIYIDDKYGAKTSLVIEQTSIANLPKLSI